MTGRFAALERQHSCNPRDLQYALRRDCSARNARSFAPVREYRGLWT